MRRVIGLCAGLLVSVSAVQAQTLSVPAITVAPGASVSVTVSGTAGDSFGLVGSTTNSGLVFNGTSFAVGTDFVILAIGVLDGTGKAVVPVTPPFAARDRFYLQALTSASPSFAPFTLGAGLTLVNSEVSRLLLSVGGGSAANGTGFALSPGVTVTRTAPGAYTVAFPGLFSGPNVIPNITPSCGLPVGSLSSTNGGFTVTFSADCAFFFTATPIRR